MTVAFFAGSRMGDLPLTLARVARVLVLVSVTVGTVPKDSTAAVALGADKGIAWSVIICQGEQDR